ncbi:FAD-dependent monooxygenase [Kitasatospora sp. NPDC093558]|uniref:FAD-dependent monooxygenase n=1 Tax=Kitasatospora sp. NPDC093558 TaxID=3155201 RepID=UPI003443B17F
MRIACIGGGPGASLLALLLHRTTGHEVDVYERSPRGATYGFGVVFSRFSLARLRRAAPDVVAALLGDGARWDDVEVRRDGERTRSSGHGFAAVERKLLLGTLHRLAEEAGARLHFETEADAAELLTRYDLVVAADGAGSRTRPAFGTELGAKSATCGGRYAWFGVDREFDAMTFLFAESEYGPLGAHVYPYGPGRSTFLVELGEETWRNSPFTDGHALAPGQNDEQAMEFCARTFAADLEGATLLGNGSRWLSFPWISAERWSTGRLVGLGDAVHTAHFSVGSGTTMALEDAVELARSLAGATEDGEALGAALAAYESARRPAVESVQQAAWASQRMWEHPAEHAGLDTDALMIRLLSRTGQSPADLLLRLDPELGKLPKSPLTALPRTPVRTLAGPAAALGYAVAFGPEDAVLVAEGAPLPPEGHRGPLLVEFDAATADLRDEFAAAARLHAVRHARPDALIGVLLRSPGPAEEPVSRVVEAVRSLVRVTSVDVVAVAPGDAPPAANRVAQMAVAERLYSAGPPIAYVCGPDEVSQGWTHVQAGRADAVWTTTA